MAKTVTDNLGGAGLFGVEFFLCGDEVIFPNCLPGRMTPAWSP